jgi:hypothetical protein
MAVMRATSAKEIEAAVDDLQSRTLGALSTDLTRLVYLSSTRDYNTGEYQHAGLADRYGAAAAQKALARCHEEVFQSLLATGLRDLARQLEEYIASTGAEQEKVLDAWRRLQAYRILIPAGCDEWSADFFASNIKIALEAVRVETTAPAH